VEMRAGEGQRTARTGRFLLRLRERPRIAVTSPSPKGCWDSVERTTWRLGGANAAKAGEGEWGPHANSRARAADLVSWLNAGSIFAPGKIYGHAATGD
jgi:hypothetical protein